MSALAVRNSEFVVHEPGEDQDTLVVLDASIANAFACRVDRNAAQSVQESVDAALQIELVVDFLAVSSLGMPSANLSVPKLVSTLSGVVICGGMTTGSSAANAGNAPVDSETTKTSVPRLMRICHLIEVDN